MSAPVPHFELKRQYDDGSESEPMLFPLHELADALVSSRRGFLAAGITAGAVLGNLPQRASAAPLTSKTLPRAHNGAVRSLAISADGAYLATACAEDFKLWSLAENKIELQQPANGLSMEGVALAGRPALLVAGRQNGRIDLFETNGQLAQTDVKTITAGLTALYAPRDGATLFAGTKTGEFVEWSLPDLKVVGSVSEHKSSITCFAASADGALLATADQLGLIRLWSRKDRTLLASLKGHGERVTHLAFKPDGSHLMSRGDDRTIRLWNLPGGELFKTLEGPWASAETMTLASNGRFLITSARTTLTLWRISNGESLGTLLGHRAPVTCVAISPDNTWAASGDAGGVVIVWNLKERRATSYLFDPESSNNSPVGSSYEVAEAGRTVRFTLPCGSPIPAGAICTCNCVPGSLELVRVPTPAELSERELLRQEELERRRYEAEERKLEAQARREEREFERLERLERRRFPNGYPPYNPPAMGGGGGLICTCDLIYICHAGQLLAPSMQVRAMAENLLLLGGASALDYLRWAGSAFDGRLRERTLDVTRAIHAGALPTSSRWPAVSICRDLLASADDVIATMAAQCLALRHHAALATLPNEQQRVAHLLAAARQRPWQVRYGAR